MTVAKKIEEMIVHPIIVPTQTGNLQTLNFYLVQINTHVVLIDAGMDNEDCWDAFCHVMEKQDFTLAQLDAIILTHNHADHIGIVNRIRDLRNIPVYAHEKAIIRLKRDQAFLERRISFFNHLYEEMGCKTEAAPLIERMKTSIERNKYQRIEGDIIPLVEGDCLFGLEVVEAPGHAPDHIFLWQEGEKVAFVGDVIIAHSPSNALIELGEDGQRTTSLITYEQSLKKLMTYHLEVAYAGHGKVITNPHAVIENKLMRIQDKGQRVIGLLEGKQTAAQIAKTMYQKRYEPLLPLVMSEVIGHLDRLVYLEKARTIKEDGIIYYEKNE